MKRYYIDYPRSVSISFYNKLINRVLKKLGDEKKVISVYQIGHVNNPGISDLDLVVIFKNDCSIKTNILDNLTSNERYILLHNLFGLKIDHFEKSQQYSLFHNYRHLFGEKLILGNKLNEEEQRLIKQQIALEYLIEFFISFSVQKTYGIYRVRGLLLHVKALMYDLEFLDVSDGEVYDLINEIILIRDDYFKKSGVKDFINDWIIRFENVFSRFLNEQLIKNKLYLPHNSNLNRSKNIDIFISDKLECVHEGFTLPNKLYFFGRKYMNVQNRFNYFKFGMPFYQKNIPNILKERFTFIEEMKAHNEEYLKHYMPLMSSFGIL